MDEPAREIVAFDFDGTLTIRDSLTAFLKWRAGGRAYARALASMGPQFASYLSDRDRGRLKEALLVRLVAGEAREAFVADAERFAEEVFERFIRPDALQVWNDWANAGVERVIVTASPALTVAPFARRLGAERLIGTRLQVDLNDCLTGRLRGENCRGAEKVARIRAVYGEHVRVLAAYGDTGGDREMLAISEMPGYRVFRRRP